MKPSASTLKRVLLLDVFVFFGVNSYLLLKPSYVSNWEIIEAQSDKAEVVFHHGFNALPVKVVAEVKIVLADGKTYIFDSVGTAQVTDNLDQPYGGVISLYNDRDVFVYAPKLTSENGTSKGRLAFIGGSAWTGYLNSANQNAEMPSTGHVRIRAWKYEDFPAPNFKKTSIPVAVQEGDGFFQTIPHSLKKHPDYVIVQIRGENSGLTSQAQGSVSVFDHKTNTSIISCVVFAYSENAINIWAPGTNAAYPNRRVTLFHTSEGWGTGNNSVFEISGFLSIYAWTFQSLPDKEFYLHQTGADWKAAHNPFSTTCSNLDDCLLSLDLTVNKGLYNSFRFPYVGSVMNDGFYGMTSGVLLAYKDNKFYLWKPTNGYVVAISGRWGTPVTHQTTNDANLRLTLWQQFDIESINCKPDTKTFQDIANATTTLSSESYNSTLTMSCDHGFTQTAGNESATCSRNGKWNGYPIVCQLIICPGDIGNGSILNGWLYTDGINLGNTSLSGCFNGYQLEDLSSKSRVCQQNSTWSNTYPLCTRVMCSSSLDVIGSTFTTNGTQYMDVVTYQCSAGYQHLNGSLTTTCQSNGQWSGTAPVCQQVKCSSSLDVIGSTFTTNGTQYMGVVTYQCSPGYPHIYGSLTRTCQSNGKWSGTAPVCQHCQCSCVKKEDISNISIEEAMKQIVEELKLDKQETSLNKRSKISVYEDRPTAKGIGFIGCSVLVGVALLIVVPDVLKLFRSITSLLQKQCTRTNSKSKKEPTRRTP